MHHVTILGIWPTWRTIFSMYLFLFLTLYMFRAHRAHHQEIQIVSIQALVAVTLCRWPCRLQVGSELTTCIRHGHRQNHRQLPEVVLTQFVSPDDEHDVLETCRELKIKINTQKELCITLVIYQESCNRKLQAEFIKPAVLATRTAFRTVFN